VFASHDQSRSVVNLAHDTANKLSNCFAYVPLAPYGEYWKTIGCRSWTIDKKGPSAEKRCRMKKALLRRERDTLLQSEEVIQEVFASVLVARLCNGILFHDVVVCVVSLPRFLLVFLGYTSFFLTLEERLACSQALRM